MMSWEERVKCISRGSHSTLVRTLSYTFDNNGNRTMTSYQTGSDNRLTNDGTYSYLV